jgi:hypothetical protein
MIAEEGEPSWPGGPRRLTMYLATLGCATSNRQARRNLHAKGSGRRLEEAGALEGRVRKREERRSPAVKRLTCHRRPVSWDGAPARLSDIVAGGSQPIENIGAGEGNRTLVISLEG